MNRAFQEDRLLRYEPLPAAPVLERFESPSSWFDRLMALYGLTRTEFWGEAKLSLEDREIDALWDADLDRDLHLWVSHVCAPITGVTESMFRDAASRMPSWTVAPKVRNAYCPLCFDADIQSGLIPRLRQEWAAAWLTHCKVHCCPLSSWKYSRGDGQRVLPGPQVWSKAQAQSRRYGPAFRRDLELTRRLIDDRHDEASEVADLWRHQMLIEQKLDQMVAPKRRALLPSTVLSSVELLRDVVQLVLRSYGPPGRDSYRRSVGPAAASEWLYGPSIFRSTPSAGLQFEDFSPAARRNVLWLAGLLADGGEFFVRVQKTSFRSYCCRSCAWSTVIQNIEVEHRPILQQGASIWPDELREALDRAIQAATPRGALARRSHSHTAQHG